MIGQLYALAFCNSGDRSCGNNYGDLKIKLCNSVHDRSELLQLFIME
jgi:hypothetical protein